MKPLQYLRNLPIGRKLTLLLLTPCLVVLLLAGAALLGFQIKMFRNDFARDITFRGGHRRRQLHGRRRFQRRQGRHRNPPLAPGQGTHRQRHPDPARRHVFARYGHHADAPVIETADRFVFREADALMIKPVMLEGKQVATLNVVSDYRAVYAGLLKLVGWMLLIVVVVGVGVAVLLSNWLQRFISDPVLRLARTAQTVADNNDYSVRAREESSAELGILTRTFNQMLARIQEQDEAITLSQHKARSAHQFHRRHRLGMRRRTRSASPSSAAKCERILGYTPEHVAGRRPISGRQHLHPDDAAKAIQICRD